MNPTLMRKAEIVDCGSFACFILPLRSSQWDCNVCVKIYLTNTLANSTKPLRQRLTDQHLKMKSIEVILLDQLENIVGCPRKSPSGYISPFAGGMADTRRDPVQLRHRADESYRCIQKNVVRGGDEMASDLFENLHAHSIKTVRMLYEDSKISGFTL